MTMTAHKASDASPTLRALVEQRRALLVPGAANALTARVIEAAGFEAIYVTGAGIANTELGLPDIGLTSATEIANVVSRISDITRLPLIVDIDTGFGNPLNTIRTVQLMERAGASALQIEDQIFPKRCGHFSGKEVIPAAEMVQKIKAAVDTRRSRELLIIARTDARAIEGIDRAIDRARGFIDAGADITFVEAPKSREEMAKITASLAVPQVANLVVGGLTPLLSQAELAKLGFGLVLYANAPLQASILAMREVLEALRRDGGLERVRERLADFKERQRVVDKDSWDALEKKYKE
jgi:2-methylisocitrate lyase-like PEP mutase family enzyme